MPYRNIRIRQVGIGKYSSLACSNTVYITSYYEGTAYYYVMVKSGNSITINLLMEKSTTEKNGVEVTIKNLENLSPYIKALDYIVFFPNVYVDFPEIALNSAKLKRFDNFAAATIKTKSKLLLGNVLYPCNSSLLNRESKNFLYDIENTGIVIKFEVGEINITPNRESIIYTSDTIKKIEERIKAAKDELNGIIAAKVTKDYDNLEEYFKAISVPVHYEPVSGELRPGSVGYRVRLDEMNNTSITFKGNDLMALKSSIRSLLSLKLPNFKGIVYGDKIYQKKCPYGSWRANQIQADKVVMLNEGTRLINSVKIYLKENWDGYAIMTYLTLDEFKDYVKEELTGVLALPDGPESTIIVKGIYDALLSKVIQVDLDSEDTYVKLKKELSTSNLGTIAGKEVILYVYCENSCYRNKQSFKRFTEALKYIKELRKGILLANMDTNERLLWDIARARGFTLIKARKDVVSYLKASNLKCLVDIDWVMNDDPVLRIVAAIIKSFPNGMDQNCVYRICDNISSELSKEFKMICHYYNKYTRDNYNYSAVATRAAELGKCDQYTMYICSLMKRYIMKHKEVETIVDSATLSGSSILTTAVILRTKAYRVSAQAYKRVKDNKLLNVLCKK